MKIFKISDLELIDLDKITDEDVKRLARVTTYLGLIEQFEAQKELIGRERFLTEKV